MLIFLLGCGQEDPPVPDVATAKAIAAEWVGDGQVRGCRNDTWEVRCDVVTSAGCEVLLSVKNDAWKRDGQSFVAIPWQIVCPGGRSE